MHCDRPLSRNEQDGAVLGKCQFSFQPTSAPQPGHELVCDPLLARSRCRMFQLGWRRRVQGEVRVRQSDRTQVLWVANTSSAGPSRYGLHTLSSEATRQSLAYTANRKSRVEG